MRVKEQFRSHGKEFNTLDFCIIQGKKNPEAKVFCIVYRFVPDIMDEEPFREGYIPVLIPNQHPFICNYWVNPLYMHVIYKEMPFFYGDQLPLSEEKKRDPEFIDRLFRIKFGDMLLYPSCQFDENTPDGLIAGLDEIIDGIDRIKAPLHKRFRGEFDRTDIVMHERRSLGGKNIFDLLREGQIKTAFHCAVNKSRVFC